MFEIVTVPLMALTNRIRGGLFGALQAIVLIGVL